MGFGGSYKNAMITIWKRVIPELSEWGNGLERKYCRRLVQSDDDYPRV